MKKLRRKIRLSLEGNDLKEMGEEASLILEAIKKNGTISEASRELSISYKHTWSVLRKLREILGEEVVEATHGGRGGGGKSILTEAGNSLLEEYRRVEEGLSGVLREEGFWETLGLKISARNRLSGKVRTLEKDGIAAKITIEVKAPTVITAMITREAVDYLDLKTGDEVQAIVKATEVIIAKKD